MAIAAHCPPWYNRPVAPPFVPSDAFLRKCHIKSGATDAELDAYIERWGFMPPTMHLLRNRPDFDLRRCQALKKKLRARLKARGPIQRPGGGGTPTSSTS